MWRDLKSNSRNGRLSIQNTVYRHFRGSARKLRGLLEKRQKKVQKPGAISVCFLLPFPATFSPRNDHIDHAKNHVLRTINRENPCKNTYPPR
jgi:hypothetical protein